MSSSKSVKVSRTGHAIRSWTAKPILGSEFTEPPKLQEVYVGFLKQRKDTSAVIQSISSVLPGFHHLRRCSNGRLLLAPLRSGESSSTSERDGTLSEDELKNQLKEKGFDLSLLADKFQVTKVPAKPPRTKAQAGEASKVWPVNFHPDATIESLIDGSVFDEASLRVIEGIMSLVIEATRLETVGNLFCTGAAAVVDPEDGRILAVSAARIDRHPMWHAAMLAVDLVAKLHGGGAWRLDDGKRDEAVKKGANHAGGEEDVEKEKETLGEGVSDVEGLRTRLGRIKRRYEEDTPLCYPRSLSTLTFPPQAPLRTRPSRKGRRNSGANAKEEGRGVDAPDTDRSGPYLCTGYWVFLLSEPCPLCAMALLHSRVSRIFYGAANPRIGVLGSVAVLHTMPGLNHRYRVWSGILERECQRAADKVDARRAPWYLSPRLGCPREGTTMCSE
ncbi:PREDICTED: probable inactive tRNA-specific adenosine deaminase-like protein 3 [Dinoponera quadriceps]|uniref:Probable inactive tRNA-specific adenosine deaminase-like protein 3 n=1 Tax=Dinoponera quadriceps TaxID=609295 RepID=A0A6P3Y1D6_DINQU|nr:PREDICTED: probable inactive tRNA-specific adenosine deaminase-like protein 3 [Dinoponera quadriceps]